MATTISHYELNNALDDIRRTFGLGETELADLFGVTPLLIEKWRLCGAPVERVAYVDRVRELAAYFTRRFIAVRLPQIVRTPCEGLGGKSLIATVTHSGVEPIYAYLEQLFSYTTA